jgi:Predicted nucleotide-binding protein containing TIR-like domain
LKPLVFIGSSVEGLSVANAIQQGLQRYTYPKVWTQGVFGASSVTIDALIEQVAQNDFGVFVMTADDVVNIRKTNYHVTRDNVLLEGSLFMGRYGRERVFLVKPMGMSDFHIPTDLLGFTFSEYDPGHAKVDVRAAMGPVCTEILTAINKVPNFQNDVGVVVRIVRGGPTYPIKVWADITNHGTRDAVLRANYFTYGKGLRPAPNAAPYGNPANLQFKFHFPGPGGHSQLTYLVRPGQATNVWVGVDPSHRDPEITAAIAAKNVAELHVTCSWLEQKDVTIRNYVVEI